MPLSFLYTMYPCFFFFVFIEEGKKCRSPPPPPPPRPFQDWCCITACIVCKTPPLKKKKHPAYATTIAYRKVPSTSWMCRFRFHERCFEEMTITKTQSISVRPSHTVSRLSRRNFSWSSHYSKSLSGYWMVFPGSGATMFDRFEHVD